MILKFYFASFSLAAFALLVSTLVFTGDFHTQANAQSTMMTSGRHQNGPSKHRDDPRLGLAPERFAVLTN